MVCFLPCFQAIILATSNNVSRQASALQFHRGCYHLARKDQWFERYKPGKLKKSYFAENIHSIPIANGRIVNSNEKYFLSLNSINALSSLLTISYMSIIMSIMTLSATMKSIDRDVSLKLITNSRIPLISTPTILLISTLFVMLGKFILGPPTDHFGGKVVMTVSMLSTSILLLGCSLSKNINVFAIFWILINIFYSSTWGAVGSVVRVSDLYIKL